MSNTFKCVILSRVMNMAFDGIVLSRVTELLNETIVTGRISKLYQISKYELLMTVRAQNENKKLLVSIHPMYARVQLTQLNYPTPDFPNALTMFLRKHIEGSFIERIEQVGLDRILKITLRGRNEFKDLVEYHLYIEIMGKHSNFILTNKEDKILECLKRVSPSDSIRIMQPGITYSYPPLLEKKNPFENKNVEVRENDLRWCILKLKSQKCEEKRQNRNVWDRKGRDTDGNDRTIPGL